MLISDNELLGVDGRPDDVAVLERSGLPAPRPPATRASLPVSALAAALQRALPAAGAEAGGALEGARRKDARRRRQSASARHDAASLRPVDPDDASQPARALGRLRLLPGQLAPLLGLKLVLLCADGTICDFDLVAANSGERDAALALLEANPIEGATIVCDNGFAGAGFEQAVRELRALLLRPSRADEPDRPTHRSAAIRQRIEAIVNSLKDQLHLERHGGRYPRRPARPRHRPHPHPLRRHQPQPTTRLPSRELTAYTD